MTKTNTENPDDGCKKSTFSCKQHNLSRRNTLSIHGAIAALSCQTEKMGNLHNIPPLKHDKKADNSRHHHWYPREMASEKQVQKFHTDNAHYPDLDSASDWSCYMRNLLQPIRSTTKIWVVTRHQYGISALVMAS